MQPLSERLIKPLLKWSASWSGLWKENLNESDFTYTEK